MTSYKLTNNNLHSLDWWEWQQLERQGCFAEDWSDVYIDTNTDLKLIRNVEFLGHNEIGLLDSKIYPGNGIANATLQDCIIHNGVRVSNIKGRLRNVEVKDEAIIENVARIEFETEASCGLATLVSVLDETGSRPVLIYPGMSAQSAALMTREPRWAEEVMFPQIQALCETHPLSGTIGERSVIKDTGALYNVFVDNEVQILGAASLSNGAIINNAATGRALASVGAGVNADGFIIEDGIVESGALLRNVYVGQGARIEKGFTAHDSLFFANCSLENGEACALFAGPYTVSMHKGSLLIGCQTSFMNAGSSTNQSNHAYKLGPVHWGILERGVKTSSNSYLMLGASIGAFSLLMGSHKTHPNSTEFPFSYLFGDAQGATVVVPAMMLRSCGLMRDEMKWPTRDRRLKRKLPMHDKIIFEVLNPFTVDRILTALDTIEELLKLPTDDDRYIRYKGMKISRASLERAKKVYTLAVFKYLDIKLSDEGFKGEYTEKTDNPNPVEWIDLAGLIMPRHYLKQAMEAASIEQREQLFEKILEDYPLLEKEWIESRFNNDWRLPAEKIKELAEQYDHIVETDRAVYRESLNAEIEMLRL